jgi:pilus assembly protein CpaB
MKRRFLTVVLFAVAFAWAASTLAYRLIAGRPGEEPQQTVTYLVTAGRDLPVGTVIRETDLATQTWSGTLPPVWISNKQEIVGRGVIAGIYRGEPILSSRLARKGAAGGLAAVIPAGMRAVAVRVDDVIGVSGFLRAGMRVDVLSSGTPPNQEGARNTVTRTILQNIEVLSAGENLDRDAEGKPVTVQVVNLLVAPEQAEVLSLAGAQTKIQLVLRNPLDQTSVKTPGTSTMNLLSGHEMKPAWAPRPAPRPVPVPAARTMVEPTPVPVTVDVIHGVKKDTVTVGHTIKEVTKEGVQ